MLYRPVNILSLLLAFGLANYAVCQDSDIHISSPAFQQAVDLYEESMHSQALLLSGSQYAPMAGNLRGHPYYLQDNVDGCTVVYEGVSFSPVRMRYDIFHDEVIIDYISSDGYPELVQLHKAKIDRFIIQNQLFVHYLPDTWANLKEGFYQPVYQGKTVLLKKITKEAQQEFDITKAITFFEEKHRYFLIKNEIAYPVNNKKSLLKLFPEEKKRLMKHARAEESRFNDNKEAGMIQLIQYYDQAENE
ncbi:MAG: hypothetical protein R3D00_30775 [Bacteroidia bacterium]